MSRFICFLLALELSGVTLNSRAQSAGTISAASPAPSAAADLAASAPQLATLTPRQVDNVAALG